MREYAPCSINPVVCLLVGVVPSGGLWHGPKIWPKAVERQDVDLRSRPSRTSTPSVDLLVPVAQCSLFIYSSLSRYAVPRPHAGGRVIIKEKNLR